MNPKLSGGSLLDVGCYPVTAMKGFFGEPDSVYAVQQDSRNSGVDTQTTCLFEYESGATAQLSSGFDTQTRQYYPVDAENGWLIAENAYAPSPRNAPDGVDSVKTTLQYEVDGREVVETFDPVNQFELEVEHFVEGVHDRQIPETDATYAVETLRMIDAIVDSTNSGDAMTIE